MKQIFTMPIEKETECLDVETVRDRVRSFFKDKIRPSFALDSYRNTFTITLTPEEIRSLLSSIEA